MCETEAKAVMDLEEKCIIKMKGGHLICKISLRGQNKTLERGGLKEKFVRHLVTSLLYM